MKTVITEIDNEVKAQDAGLSLKAQEIYASLYNKHKHLFTDIQWKKVKSALDSNTYLAVDIIDDISWLDKAVYYAERSFTLNPSAPVSTSAEVSFDTDIRVSEMAADLVVAPYSRQLHIPFTSVELGLKKELAGVNSQFSENSFTPVREGFSREILRYRLPRETFGRTSQSTNFFTSILSRDAAEPVDERETIYLTFCHGNGGCAAASITEIDKYVLEVLYANPGIKRIVVTVGDYVGSAATKGDHINIEEVANDTVRLGVKHWIKTKGFVGNDVVIGHSLGGFMSAISVNNLHNQDHLSVIYYNMDSLAHPREFATELLRKMISSGVPRFLGAALVKACAAKYDADPVKHFENIEVQNRRVVCKFEDSVIPFKASLFANLTRNKEFSIAVSAYASVYGYLLSESKLDRRISKTGNRLKNTRGFNRNRSN